MKNFLKILISILALLIIVEGCSYFLYAFKYKDAIKMFKEMEEPISFGYKIPKRFSPENRTYTRSIRLFEKKSNKKPFAIVGCSFAEGGGLKDNQILGYKLSDITNRTCYQRGVSSTGLSYVYYQIKHKLIPQDAEYVIYVFIIDHNLRLYKYQIGFWTQELNLRYKLKNGKLYQIYDSFPIVDALFTTKLIQEKIETSLGDKECQDFVLFKAMTSDMMKEFKKNYPNSKLVFLEYPQDTNPYAKLTVDAINHLKNEGYIYLNANQLVGVDLGKYEYKIEGEGVHPNEKAWSMLAPKLAEKLKM